jgi:hypothetical protein
MADMPPGLGLLGIWYIGLAYLALVIGVIVCIWIYTSANKKAVGATWPLALAVVGTVLMLPSCIIALSVLNWIVRDLNMVLNLGYLGLIGALAVLFAAFLYAMGIGVTQQFSPPLPTYRTQPQQPAPVATAAPAPRARPTERTKFIGEQAPPAAWLVPKAGSRAGQQLGLVRGVNTIGRSHKCNIALEDGSISGEHARIQFENGQFILYDLASLNGTFVNGQRVQKQLLMDGDEIKLGETVLVFKKV